jgi:hypothetical protein
VTHYQSKQEALDGWALDERIGHYVNFQTGYTSS